MNKYELLQSIEAGPFTTPANRMINFDVPDGLLVDLSQTFVQLVCRLDTENTEVHNMLLVNTDNALTPMNLDMIRNCWISGAKVGKLEDIRRVNILRHNLLELQLSTSEKISQIASLYQTRTYDNGMIGSAFVELHKSGNVPSRYVDAHLRIPLSHLYNIGEIQALDTSKTGALRIHLELENLSFLQFIEAPMFKLPALLNEGKFSNLTASTDNIVTVPELPYYSLEQSPYFVGQHIVISYVTNSAPSVPILEAATVLAVTYNSATKRITLQTSFTFPPIVAPVTTYQSITVSEKSFVGTATLSVVTAELGLAQIMGGKAPSVNELTYMTYSTEEYSNNSNSLNKMFEIEPNCVNAFLMFSSENSNLISHQDKVRTYRMRIDNLDVYDRDISVNYLNKGIPTYDALHYDSIQRAFVNASMPLKNMTFLNLRRDVPATSNDLSLADRFDSISNQILLLAAPCPLTPMSKKLQFNVDTASAEDVIENVILYKNLVRTIKL
jgi:hypothetical protein